MLSFPAISTYGAAFLSGVALHVTVFRVGEWHLHTGPLLAGTIILNGVCAYGLVFLAPDKVESLQEGLKIASSLVSIFLAGIFTSILVYRAAFHRLNSFPGPFAARLSNFYITSRTVKNYRLYEEIQDLHKNFGDIVRVGPSELSIIDPDALRYIHSSESPCRKGPWYDMLHPTVSLHLVRDPQDHARRRKTWDKALNVRALRDYEPRVSEYTTQLLHELNKSQGKPINVATWFNFYSFDVMGDVGFGQGFDMLKDGVVHWYMSLVHSFMIVSATFQHLEWIFPFLTSIPLVNSGLVKLQNWLATQVAEGRKSKSDKTDVLSFLLADYDLIEETTAQDSVNLQGDAHLIVVAGSDTTAASLTCLFFELARHPEVVEKLRIELDQHYTEHQGPDAQSLSTLGYLQACIDEALRLYPPIPSGLQRLTPPEGLQLGGTFIPGDTIVVIPTYTFHRDERAFSRPNEFIPERWTSEPELVKNGSVFAPFSVGRYSCAGKRLAMMELRFVASQVVRRFDMKMAPGQTSESFLGSLKDGFTLSAPKLELILDPRKS